MTNTIAFALVLALGTAAGLDLLVNDGTVLMFLARKFLVLLDWVVFWH
jgi:hypothetical protein